MFLLLVIYLLWLLFVVVRTILIKEVTMNNLGRDLGLSMMLLSEAAKAVETATPIKDSDHVMNEIKARMLTVYDFIESGDMSWVGEGNKDYKELYAHSKCYILFDSLYEVFSDLRFNIEGLIMVDDEGNNAHYVLKVMADKSTTIYVDAYGFYRNISDIEARYKDTTIVSHQKFTPHEDDENEDVIDEYRNLFITVFDEIEGVVFEKYGVEDISDICDYVQLFGQKQVLALFESLDDVLATSRAEQYSQSA